MIIVSNGNLDCFLDENSWHRKLIIESLYIQFFIEEVVFEILPVTEYTAVF